MMITKIIENYQYHPLHLLAIVPITALLLWLYVQARLIFFKYRAKIRYSILKNKEAYKKFPKAPLEIAFSINDIFGPDCFALIEKFRQKDGSFPKVWFVGPGNTGSPTIGVCDADVVKEIFNNPDIWIKPYIELKPLFGDGLTLSDGEIWAAERKNLTPLFHFNSLKEMIPEMVSTGKELIKEIKEKRYDLSFTSAEEIFLEHAMKNILNLAFGGDLDPAWMARAWNNLLSCIPTFFKTRTLYGELGAKLYPWNNLYTERKKISNMVSKLVEHRRKEKVEKHDMLSTLLNSTINGKPVPESVIIDEGVTFLLAGHDSVANLLSWSCYFLSLNPEVQKKLQKHVDDVLKGHAPTMDSLSKLNYVRSTLEESLRLAPAVAFSTRRSTKDVEISGYLFPKGTEVAMFLRGMHTSSEYWGKDYLEFKPERFLNEESQRHPYCYVPFLAGPRNCIGKKYAIQEGIISLAMLMQNYTVEHNTKSPVKELAKGALCPTGLELKFHKRDDAIELDYE